MFQIRNKLILKKKFNQNDSHHGNNINEAFLVLTLVIFEENACRILIKATIEIEEL